MNAPARTTPATPILRNAAGEPPLGIGGLAFRDDQGEMFFYDADRSPAARFGVLELEDGSYIVHPFHVESLRFADRSAALRFAIAGLVRKARKYMRAKEDEGIHWGEGLGGRVIEWALLLKPEHEQVAVSSDVLANIDQPISEVSSKPYKVSVQFSGGAASYVAAKLILDEFGHDGVALIFADTLIEDEDLYRFLNDAEERLQHPVIRISEGRDPWTVFFNERMMGNSRVDPCSKILKRKLLDKWRVENCASDCTMVIGYDASEDFRFQPLKERMAPVKVRAPLLEHGIWKEQAYAIVEADGLRLPRLYKMGFPHNNCGGFCVKAGHASFALLLENLPSRYAEHEAKEEEFRAFIGKDVSIMRDRRGGVSKPLTMRAFRERHQADPALVDRSDLGGCTCMEEPTEGLEEIKPAANVANDLTSKTTVEEITDPVIAGLIEANRARTVYPAGHCFSRTNPVINGKMTNVATCQCGDGTFVYKSDLPIELLDAAEEAHWRRFDHLPENVDGRGQPINAEKRAVERNRPGFDLAKKRSRRSAPKAGEAPDLANAALPEPASVTLSVEGAGSSESQPGAGGLTSAPIIAGGFPEPLRSEPAHQAPPDVAGSLLRDEYLAGIQARAEQAAPIGAGSVADVRCEACAPAQLSGGESAAPLSDDDAEFWNSPLIKAALDLAWREVDPYEGFLSSKVRDIEPTGFEVDADDLNPALKQFQRDIVVWALRRGRAAIFAGTGLGKTLQQLVWADEVSRRHGRVLVLTPLAVAQQTVDEAAKFGIGGVAYARSGAEAASRIVVANYERLHLFDPAAFVGVVLDESSILKSFDGKTRTVLTDAFAATQFKLCCTATPAPNDYTELGTHAEFLGVLQHKEMLATWFVHDGSSRATNVENYGQRQGSDWRLKGHAHEDFWRWLATWCVMIRHPRDLGYDDVGYDLPPLRRHPVVIKTSNPETLLGPQLARSMQERLAARRETIHARVAAAAAMVNAAPDRQWLVWCNLNDESTALAAAISGAVEVRGTDDPDEKAARLLAFARGEIRILVSKPSIAGWGMNFQRCADMVFVGLNDSFEQLYQAIRRCWRFGQTREVNVYLISADVEGEVVANLEAKEAQADYMAEAMAGHMRGLTVKNLRSERTISVHDVPMRLPNGHDAVADVMVAEQVIDDQWAIWNGDCVEVSRGLPDESVHYTIYSPPFPALYTFSDDLRDMSNCLNVNEFWDHYEFLIEQCYRITKPGRLVTVHCMQLPTSKTRDGYIGLRDFRGQIIAAHQRAGFIYHSEVGIRKDPVQAMQRTKHIGLLHKQLAKDSAMSRMAVADYMVTMRKPGDNAEPIAGLIDRYYGDETTPCGPMVQESRMRGREILWPGDDRYSIAVWQRYAEPFWMDISPSDVLSRADAREEKDERHISPLQLTAIRRCLDLWSNEGDIVFSPFAGIGSELVTAVQLGRRACGSELKPSYFRQAVQNLRNLNVPEPPPADPALFDIAALDAANVPPPLCDDDMMEIEA